MSDSGDAPPTDRDVAGRVHALVEQGAVGEATHLIQEVLYDLRRGRRQIDRTVASGLLQAAIRLRLLNDAEQWARYVIGGTDAQVDPGDRLQARSTLIAVLLDQQRFDEAALLVGHEEPPVSVSPQVLFGLRVNEGNALGKLGRHEDALVRYSAAADCAEHVAREELAILELNRGASLNSLGRNDEAIDAYRKCISLGQGTVAASAVMNLANALRDAGRMGEADDGYRQAVIACGGDMRARAQVLRNHAQLLATQGRRDDAKAMLREAAGLCREARDVAGQVQALKRLAQVLADESDYQAAARTGYHAFLLSRSARLPVDKYLMRLADAWTAMEEFTGQHPDAAAALLVSHLRAASPGDWVALATQARPEVLRFAVSVLDRMPDRAGIADRGRATEAGWIKELLVSILDLGKDLGVAEHHRRMQQRMSTLDIFARFVRLDDWVDRKNFYKAERAVLESPDTLDMRYVLEYRADQLQLDPTAVAAACDLVRACMESGLDIAFAQLPELYPDELLHRFVNAASWWESLQIIQAHEQYFASGLLAETLSEDARDAPPAVKTRLQEHIKVLRRCREIGVGRALAEVLENDEASALGGKITIWTMAPEQPDRKAAEPQTTGAISAARLAVARAEESGDRRLRRYMLAGLAQAYLDDNAADRGDNLRRAADALLAAAALGPDVPDDRGIACLLSLGRVQMELAGLDNDPQLLDRALGAFERALSDAQVVRAPRRIRLAAREVFSAATALAARSVLPDTRLQLTGKRKEACEAAMDATDELMRSGDLTDRVSEQQDALWAYACAVGELTDQSEPALALIAAERGRARGFLAEIELLDILPPDVPSDLAERELAARQRIRDARRDPADRVNSTALDDANHDLAMIHAELTRASPEIARLRSAAPPDVDELITLAGSLGPKAAVVSWYTTPAECFAFAVFGGTGEIHAQRTGLDMPGIAAFVELAANDIWQRPSRPDQQLSPMWRALTDTLLPCAWRDRLAAADKILLVPHGLLGEIPLHALPLEWLGGRSLQELAPVGYPSGLILAHRLRTRRPTGKVAVVLAHSGDSPDPGAPSEFEEEARSVAALSRHPRLLIGPAARIARISELASDAAILHIAAHGTFDLANPVGSAVHLSDGTWTGNEPLSPPYVISQLRLPGTVVVLSGCETARHSVDLTDESEGLVRAFLIAGASAVVASQWRVDSPSTRNLMEQFHVRLHESGDVAGSLRVAAMTLRRTQATRHPYFWAPFIAVGGAA